MEDQSKSIFLSLTFWGVVAALVSVVSKKAGWTIDADGLANDLAGLASLVVIMIGRFRARQPVHIIGPVPVLEVTSIKTKEGGFTFWPYLLGIALLIPVGTSVVMFGCAQLVPQADTKNKAQALTYYTIGQGYAGIDAAYKRKEISQQTVGVLVRQVDLARGILDIVRNPHNPALSDVLKQTVTELSSMTINGHPAITEAQKQQAFTVIDIAGKAATGGPLPESSDTAGWMLLGADVLRSVSQATAAR